jgi:PAS domain-containing protein
MDADWITSPSARRVLQHAEDSRPAWLWSQDGQSLLWRNAAAELFLAKLKKHGLKRAPLATPIKGQVARNIRLGSVGRTSLARIQFIAGDKPASSTCATTPLTWQDGQTALLVVGVDPIDAEVLAAAASERVQDAGSESSVEPAAESHATTIEAVEPAAVDEASIEDLAEPVADDDSAYQRELENWRDAEQVSSPAHQFVLVDEPETRNDVEPPAEVSVSRLSRLVDRLAEDEALYAPLTEDDEAPALAAETLFKVIGQGVVAETDIAGEPDGGETEAEADLPALSELDGEADMLAAEPPLADEADVSKHVERMEAALAALTPKPATDAESVERVSRYNFDELSRILNDRVGDPAQPAQVPASAPAQTGSLINLGGETLVLNRLPLGILVFRDQQVLFANRAITEMVGYDSVENLRAAGLAAVFPAAGPEGQGAGPVNHLVQRDGTLVPVTARLQSISWQGRPALMLSASATEVRTGHEAAVQAFAQTFADVRGDGYFETNRAGVISAISPKAMALLGESQPLEGAPLLGVTASGEAPALREFLERPARFAETARPCMTLRSSSGKAEIILFAQGQAGVVTGYFGFVRGHDIAPARLSGPVDTDPALLARISRGVRRPLNTIIGFSDLIRSKAFGALDDERYESYAEDITTAGQEIAALVDELDDYARLRDGRYLPQRASIDLTGLLESCVVRIRQQASSARVIVRNAISENLPRITADRASLAQAVLNLMASAIDQTPTGGAVVISAQIEDDGGIAVHVRDSSTNTIDMGERFVVFRDGVSRDGTAMTPVRSSVGLALTRSLLAVNAFSLSMDPAGEQGMLFTLLIPADLVERATTPDVAE